MASRIQSNSSGANIGFEQRLWETADKMCGYMDPSEYKHVMLGLIFLKYISDAFEEKFNELALEDRTDPEDRDEYLAENVFWVPKSVRWNHVKANARSANIGDDLPAPEPGEFYVYVIKCSNDSLYIGQTDNIPRRWKEHLSGQGADWMKKYPPVYIPHYETFSSRKEAVARKKELETTSGRRWLKEQVKNGSARPAGSVPFEEKMQALTNQLAEQMAKSKDLDAEICK